MGLTLITVVKPWTLFCTLDSESDALTVIGGDESDSRDVEEEEQFCSAFCSEFVAVLLCNSKDNLID
jgi:hypothetical protein